MLLPLLLAMSTESLRFSINEKASGAGINLNSTGSSRIAPFNEFTVIPDMTTHLVVRNACHQFSPSLADRKIPIGGNRKRYVTDKFMSIVLTYFSGCDIIRK